MASIIAHKVGLAALVSAGILDLALINFALGPRALSEPTPARQVAVREPAPHAEPPAPASASAPPAIASVPPAIASAPPAIAPTDAAPPDPAPAPDAPAVEVTPPAPVVAANPSRPAAARPATKTLHVYFGSMSKRLSTRTRGILDQTARLAGTTAVIELEGHSDRVGDESYNVGLGGDRAEAAADYLVTRGIEVERIKRAPRGKLGAADTPDDELWHDRRVDVRIIEGGIE